MTAGDGKPCKKCGTSSWYTSGNCKQCSKDRALAHKRRHPEKVRRWALRWRKNNPERVRRNKRIREERRRAHKRNAKGDFTARDFSNLCDYYENRCLCCGKRTKLTPDHVIPLSRGGSNELDNIQPLCHLCNSTKQDRIIDYRNKPGMMRWIQRRLFGD